MNLTDDVRISGHVYDDRPRFLDGVQHVVGNDFVVLANGLGEGSIGC
jgi:hypothetical protein